MDCRGYRIQCARAFSAQAQAFRDAPFSFTNLAKAIEAYQHALDILTTPFGTPHAGCTDLYTDLWKEMRDTIDTRDRLEKAARLLGNPIA